MCINGDQWHGTCNYYGMDWIRIINPDAIPNTGITIGRVGRFTLILHRDKTFTIGDTNNNFSQLSADDLINIKELVELCNEWSTFHKFCY
jgi:hypothetical protein